MLSGPGEIDCDFWSEDDGRQGFCKSPSVTVCGSSFEDAKKNMAIELQTHIKRILREHPNKMARRIARAGRALFRGLFTIMKPISLFVGHQENHDFQAGLSPGG
jgi:hypothetical protein